MLHAQLFLNSIWSYESEGNTWLKRDCSSVRISKTNLTWPLRTARRSSVGRLKLSTWKPVEKRLRVRTRVKRNGSTRKRKSRPIVAGLSPPCDAGVSDVTRSTRYEAPRTRFERRARAGNARGFFSRCVSCTRFVPNNSSSSSNNNNNGIVRWSQISIIIIFLVAQRYAYRARRLPFGVPATFVVHYARTARTHADARARYVHW